MKQKNYTDVDYNSTLSAFGRIMKGMAVTVAMLLGGQAMAQSHVEVDGNVFGGGNEAPVTGTTTVTLQDNASVGNSVFGGGNAAGVSSTATVNINGGTVGAEHGSEAGVYGGCNANGEVTGAIAVNINAGVLGTSEHPLKGIFGGGYGQVTTTGANVTVTIGSTATVPTVWGNIYGGSALGQVNASTSDLTKIDLLKGTVNGNVFGGGLGLKNATGHFDNGTYVVADDSVAAIVNGNVQVNIGAPADATSGSNDVKVTGSIFGGNDFCGGPLGEIAVHIYATKHTTDNTALATANISGLSDVKNDDSRWYALEAVYGGGNLAHYQPAPSNPQKHALVYVHGCFNTIKYLYGGGNAANTPADSVIIDGGRFHKIFGGGNGEIASLPGANVTQGNAYTQVNGGVYAYIFGGSNTKGNIAGDVKLNINPNGGCGLEVVENLYGGGNLAAGKGGTLDVRCGDITLGNVYGGANAAYVDGDITLNIYGGTGIQYVFGGSREVPEAVQTANSGYGINGSVTLNLYGGEIANAFGGSNSRGNIKGTITVNVDDARNQNCPLKVDNVYGGGKDAPYTPQTPGSSPMVYVKNVQSHASAASPYNKVRLDVFGGGLGVDAVVTSNPVVYIGDADGTSGNLAQVGNNVYGGGSQAPVNGSTTVTVRKSNTIIENTIYGAGKGDRSNPDAALVSGNATVNFNNGNVYRSIYGGGELSSVGTFTNPYPNTVAHTVDDNGVILAADGHVAGEPSSFTPGTGLTSVYINGGLVGKLDANKMPNPLAETSEDDWGYIFCAGKGEADSVTYPNANILAMACSTYLEINDGLVTASVYGGSENGQVLGNTHVVINGGQIGTGWYNDGADHWDQIYDETTQWDPVLAKVREGNFEDADAAGFHLCHAWPFNPEGSRWTYDHFATHLNPADGLYYYDDQYQQSAHNGAYQAGDGHTYFGHVFGGGSGYYPYAPGKWRRSAGRVKGSTRVEITDGHILSNVYGGNEITDVLGDTYVEMSGGTIGVPRSIATIQGRPVNSNLYGAGMGDPRVMFNSWSNVNNTTVIVRGDAVVFGSVFGGGEDGHVLGNASTTIKGDAVIGTTGGSGVDGNVYGGGRGFSAWALTAGVVCGNVNLYIQENAKIHGSIYGGGRMAAVGTFLVPETDDTHYGTMQNGATHGNVAIYITGGTVGNKYKMGGTDYTHGPSYSIGDVFGGSKGTLGLDVARNQKLGLVKNTNVNISQADGKTTHILGNVYGGGEIASVGHYAYATAAQASTFNTDHPGEHMVEGDVYNTIAGAGGETVGKATITITGGTIGTEMIGNPAVPVPISSNAAELNTFAYRQAGNTLYRKGGVFGGCLGMAGVNYSGYSYVTNSEVTISGGLVAASLFGGGENGHVFNSTDVRINGGRVGIELDVTEHEEDDNGVGVVEDIYIGNVYGGGRGIDTYHDEGLHQDLHSVTAGRVRNSTSVTMTAGRVTHNIYGGGSLATVGYKDMAGTGTATVTIIGGVVGYDDGNTTFNDNGHYFYGGTALNSGNKANIQTFYKYAGNNEGNVYGSGRGHAGQNGQAASAQYISMAFVKNTNVTIGGTAQVRGSVFGGGENGHVRQNTNVTIAGTAQIGVPLMSIVDWGEDTWHVCNDGYVSHDTLSDETSSETYYRNETTTSGLKGIHLHEHWIGDNGEGPTIYRGNVYGGGRGVTPTDNTNASIDEHQYSATAGRVYGNATVTVNGGHIYHDVFGGGSLASVGTLVYNITNEGGVKHIYDPMGNEINESTNPYVFLESKANATNGWDDSAKVNDPVHSNYYLEDPVTGTGLAKVILNGGIIGTDGINNGNVFGSGRGIAGAHTSRVAHLANANNTGVYLRGAYGPDANNTVTGATGADVRGAVFGGGANGHVLQNTYVEMTGGTVGVSLPLAMRKIDERTGHGYRNYNGNVYGGGRGVSVIASSATEHLSETAGRVFGNTRVKISGGLVYHSVFGGGSLASVGTYSYKNWVEPDTTRYRHLFVEGTGQAVVNITGTAHIGNPADSLEKDYEDYTAEDALTAQYVLRKYIDKDGWLGLTPAAAADKWNHLSNDQKKQLFTELNYHYLGSNSGMVFGSGRGVGALHNNQVDQDYINSAFTRNTIVIVEDDASGNSPVIVGSVFGGGENGHVKINTYVAIKGGIIGGIPLHDDHFYPGRDNENGSTAYPSFTFSNDPNLELSLEYEDDENNAGHGPAVYRGNIYGGGRGVDHTDSESPETGYSATAGRVYGDIVVKVTGGMIYHHVFGGGSLASVGTYFTYQDGVPYRVEPLYEYELVPYDPSHTTSTVREAGKYAPRRSGPNLEDNFRTDGSEPDTMFVLVHEDPGEIWLEISGGQVGVTGVNEGSVFGGGRGIAGDTSDVVTHLAYCYKTHVDIKTGADIRGSVFGGGANGHVLTHSNVTMTGGTVGAELTDPEKAINDFGEATKKVFHGNVYGGGRGVDPIGGTGNNFSYTAGRVYGNTNVNITGGTVRHNVYGGGSLATVGTILYRKNALDPAPGTSLVPTSVDPYGTIISTTGNTTVTIGGTAEIGDDGMNNGSVFGSCRGMAGPNYSDRAYVDSTIVTINAGTDGKPFIHGSVFGSGENGHVQNSTNVTINGGTIGSELPSGYDLLSDAEKKKYTYIGNVYGAGRGVDSYQAPDLDGNGDPTGTTHDAYSMSAGYVRNTTTVNINGGTIHRNVYGGGSMGLVGNYGITGESDWFIGDPATNGKATVNINSTVGSSANIAKGYGGNVFGSSRGVANDPSTSTTDFADMAYVYKTEVNVDMTNANATDNIVYGSVYGGGENGHVDWGGTTVNIINGTVRGNVFGGGKGGNTSPTAGIVDGPTTVNIGTSEQTSNTVVIGGNADGGYVFGGNDAGSSPLGIMQVNIYRTAHDSDNTFPTISNPITDSEKATYLAEAEASDATNYAIKGVYGGGNRADVLSNNASLYSGALNTKFITQRLSQTDASVPNSLKPWPGGTERSSRVHIYYCEENTVQYVYGGGKAANTYENQVVIDGGRIYRAFAGGDGSEPGTSSDVETDASLTVKGGIVYQVFGGSNTSGEVKGVASVSIVPTDGCQIVNKDIFGGGNEAPGGNAEVNIPCSDKVFARVFGGANNADIGSVGSPKNVVLNVFGSNIDQVFGGNNAGGTIYGNVKVNILGGTLGEVFGGSNEGGNIIGDILVRVNDSVPECPLTVQTVYGGGNIVPYEPDGPSTLSAERFSPRVELINGTVSGDVFGGGLGAAAVIWGNPQVIVGSDGTNPSTSEKHTFTVLGNIYGGGSASPVKGSTLVKLTSSPDHDVTIGTSADAEGAFGGYPTEHGSIFGGGLGATAIVGGNTSVGIFGNRTTVYHNVYGGGSAGKVLGSTDVQVSADAAFTMALPNIAIAPDGKVSIASTTPGASFRYNIGATPADPTTESGTLYSAPFQATAGQFIKAIAFREDYTPSGIATTAAVPIPVPTISSDGTTATATANTTYGPADQTLYYTLDGTAPDPATATTYTTGVAVASGQVFKVVATKDDYTQSVPAFNTVATPEVTIAGGNATITCATPGATIRYVLGAEDGENPGQYLEPAAPTAWTTTGSTTYSAPVPIAEGQTIKVIADLPGYEPSHLASKTR